MVDSELTPKQKAFVANWAGDMTKAARAAGYAHPMQAGYKVLKNPKVQKAIQERYLDPAIADREARQKFWTEVMLSDREEMKDRLKASELLGKSECDFVQKLEHTGKDGADLQIVFSNPWNPDDGS